MRTLRLLLALGLLPLAAEAEEPSIIAVFDIELSGFKLGAAQRSGLDDYLFNKVAGLSQFRVVPRSEVKKRLGEQKKETYKVCYDQSCQIEIGKELAAQKSLSTKILKLGDECAVTMVLYDLRAAATEKASDASGGCGVGALVRSIESAVVALGGGGAVAAAAMAPQGKVDAERCPLPGTRRMGDPYPDGQSYYCLNEKMQMHGPMVSWQASGQMAMRAEYREGKLVGKQTFFYPTGGISEQGDNSNGQRTGTWTRYYDGGAKYQEGRYERGQRVGTWVEYNQDGKKRSETEYAGDLRNGAFVEYHQNGAPKRRGNYLNDKEDGLWVSLRSDGSREEEDRYKLGQRHGEQVELDSEGRKKELVTYASGKRHGPWEEWSVRDGKPFLHKKGSWVDGEREGESYEYYDDGQEELLITWSKGEKTGPYVRWSRSRDKRYKWEVGQYTAGKKTGTWKTFNDEGEQRLETTWENDQKNGKEIEWRKEGGARYKAAERTYLKGKPDGVWLNFRADGSPSERIEYRDGKEAARESLKK